ncbi:MULTISPECIES: hypothetical protein [Streptomyces]|nr:MULTISPECIES: hypothetical protein [Streptomyces]MYT07106.1 hypothetical protein [Streptomyces sp. SID5470]
MRRLLGPEADLIRRRPGYQLTAAGAHLDVLEAAGKATDRRPTAAG